MKVQVLATLRITLIPNGADYYKTLNLVLATLRITLIPNSIVDYLKKGYSFSYIKNNIDTKRW